MGFQQSVGGYRHAADLDRTEETVQELGRVREQQQYPLFRTHAELAKRIAYAVRPLQQLLIADPLVAALDRNLPPSSLENVAVHEIGGGIEWFRQGDQGAL